MVAQIRTDGCLLLALLIVQQSSADILRKLLIENLKSPLLATVLRSATNVAFLLVLSPPGTASRIARPSTFMILAAVVHFFSSLIQFHALKQSSLSNTVPYVSIAPAILYSVGILWLDEQPSSSFRSALCLLGLGLLALNISQFYERRLTGERFGILVLSDPGARWMLAVAVLACVVSPLDHQGISHIGSAFTFALSCQIIVLGLSAASLLTFHRFPFLLGDRINAALMGSTYNPIPGTPPIRLSWESATTMKTSMVVLVALGLIGCMGFKLSIQATREISIFVVMAAKRWSSVLTVIVDCGFEIGGKTGTTGKRPDDGTRARRVMKLLNLTGTIFLSIGASMTIL